MKTPAILLLLFGLVLTGCGGGDSNPKTTPDVQAGTCVAKEIDDEDDKAPDLNSVVDCSKPHVYEITDVIDLPDAALSGKTDEEKLANRKDLATTESDEGEENSAQFDAYTAFAFPACRAALTTATGYDGIAVDGVDAKEAGLMPLLGGQIQPLWFNVMPKEQWLEGKRQVICSARYTEPAPKDFDEDYPEDLPTKPVSSENSKPLLAAASSSSFPVVFRWCTTWDEKEKNVNVGCDKQHYSENLFQFNAIEVLDQDFVNKIKPKKATDAEYKELDRVCAKTLPQVMSKDFDQDGAKVRSQGFPGFQWTDDYKTVVCDLVSVDSKTTDLGPGALAWTDARDVKLVDAK